MTTTLFKTLGAATTLAAIVLTAGSASAASLTKTASVSANTGDFQTTDFQTTLSVQKFDSSLGKLKKVTLEFLGEITGDGTVRNRSNNSKANPTITLNGNITLENAALTPNPLFQITPTIQKTFSLDPRAQIQFNGLIGSGTSSKIFTELQHLNIFTGNGNLDFLFKANASSASTGSGNFGYDIDTLARGSVGVTYEYDAKAVPEPSTVLGFGLMAGVGLLSKRKKSWLKSSN